MKNLKINLTSSTTAEVAKVEEKVEVVKLVCETFEDNIPSNWIITPTENGISAISSKTRETFEGTIQEFNKRLKG